jgi:hypothetical protein
VVSEEAPRFDQQLPAAWRESRSLIVAFEQAFTDDFLELLDMNADGRGAFAEMGGSGLKLAELRHGVKGPQEIDIKIAHRDPYFMDHSSYNFI